MSSIQRITGTNSGLDVDTLVKTALKGDQSKIDKEVQNQKVMQYQQDQYKQIMSDASNFYDKYFDVLKSGSMMSTSAYQTETFTSSDGTKVTAKGLAGASLDNYSVSVTQLAAKASDSLSVNTTGNQTIKIGTATVTFKAVTDGNTTVSNYNTAIADEKLRNTNIINGTIPGDKTVAQAALDDLNGNTITAKYSEFSKSITFTASSFGSGGFTLNSNTKAVDKYLEATIKNSSGNIYTISSADKKTSNSVTIDNVQFDFKAPGASTATKPTSSLSDVSTLTTAIVGGDVSPITELTALAEDSTTTTTPAADGGKTTITKSADGTKITKRVTDSLGNTTTTTTDTNQPGITSVVDKNGIITTTDTSKSGSGYTLKTVKAGTTTTTTKTNDDGTIPIIKK
ncbi:flagellar capping protein FliD [Clostridium beijerinckii]|nr:flagellar cap protein FliD N-terminal domain-containing protein [Clostridium beijerinckii]NRW36235.1 flagellar capping protein FliD [Clostridium beijerinckii]